ncbi:flagellar filament capping protein FliD [Acetoanaerobium noterae]|uniref:flagellar filament capping protein FliD n=1 Tax=Acetoanaerobium noterae TaxID=745369 RepID=UPI0028ABE2DC|nr:flagellar filament capping protein FliD [Acetoanaerobium noterae]
MVNPIRFGGMASGLDTESLVKQLVSAEKTRVDKFTQQKIWKQWQQTAYNETNKTMANFILDTRKNLGLTRTTSTGALVSGSINTVDWVKKASSSNDTAFEVKATASAPAGVSTLKVEALATGANVSSTSNISDTITKASDITGLTFTDGKAEISINGKSIVLAEDDTLNQISQKIRAALPEVNANYDSGAKRFFMSSKATGSDSKIEFGTDGNTDSFMTAMKFTDLSKAQGTNSKIIYNGGAVIEYKSNNISINGLNLTLKTKTNTEETIRVDTDVDGAYNKIKEFVDEYNKLIDGFDSKLAEKKYRDFQPLTDEQKEAMSETDIKLWEEKAKSGLLKNDETMTRMMQTIRQDIYQKVDGFGSIYELGITTGSWRDNGKLTIDETKLKDALRNDSEKVLNTLFKTSDTPEVTINSGDNEATRVEKQAQIDKRKAESGAFIRIFDGLTSGIKDIVDKSGPGSEASLLRSVKSNILIEYVTSGSRSLIDKDVSEIDKRISRETERLASLEERYWKQFTALEKAMSQMNSQSSWLSQQFGGGQQ